MKRIKQRKVSNQTSRVRNTLMNTTFGIVVKFITLFSNFLIRTVFIRYLGIEYTGVSAVFTDLLNMLSFAELGIGTAITYALYRPIAQEDHLQIAKVMNLFKKAYRIIALVIFSVGILLVPFLDRLITNVPSVKESITLIYILYIVNTSVSYLFIYKSTLLTANQQAYVVSLISVICTMLRIAIQTVVIALFRNFILFLVIGIVFTVVQNLIISIRANREFEEILQYKKEQLSSGEKKHIFKDVKALVLYKVSGTVLTGTDNLIISSMLGANIVGFVSNYSLIVAETYHLALQFLNSVTASLGNLIASKDEQKQYSTFQVINFACETFFTICTVGLFCLLDEFVGTIWLGEEFLVSRWVILLLCLDFFLKGNATIVNSFRNANGLFVQGQYRPLAMAILKLIISVAAVIKMGLPGIYLGTVIARICTQLWYDPWILYKHAFRKNVKFYIQEYLAWVVVLCASVAASEYVNHFISIRIPIISFAVHGIICGLITVLFATLMFWHSGKIHQMLIYIKSHFGRVGR